MESLLTGVVPVNLMSSPPTDPRVRRRRAVHSTVVQRTNVTRIKIIRCVFRSKGTFQQGSTEIEIQKCSKNYFFQSAS